MIGKHAGSVTELGNVGAHRSGFRARAKLYGSAICIGPSRQSNAEADHDVRRARESGTREGCRATLESIMSEARVSGRSGTHVAATHNASSSSKISCQTRLPNMLKKAGDLLDVRGLTKIYNGKPKQSG